MASSDDSTLIKVAVFGITMSLLCSAMITLLLQPTSDYDMSEIAAYRNQLVDFSGEGMLNESPWVLTGVYTPWISSLPVDGHLDPDGWLYGESIDYDQIGKAADISLSPSQKSSVPISIADETVDYTYVSGVQWWADSNNWWTPITGFIGDLIGADPNVYSSGTASIWNYTGYRYVFDPTLPFATDAEGNNQVSVKDGALSLVWYSYNGQEGLSGGLQIYGGDVLLSNIAAVDIINAYSSVSGLASTYDFNFNGASLTLSIRFDQQALEAGVPLMEAWTTGAWSMAISSKSAGNFLDIENSASFTNTAGAIIDTFTQIFTFSVPSIDNFWMDLVLWLLVGLPMSVAMICISLRTISAIKLW